MDRLYGRTGDITKGGGPNNEHMSRWHEKKEGSRASCGVPGCFQQEKRNSVGRYRGLRYCGMRNSLELFGWVIWESELF